MLRSVISLVTTSAFLVTGCASGRTWPQQPQALASSSMLDHPISTIDVLPLDLQLWAQPGYNIDLTQLREGAEDSIRNVALQALVQRSYAVGAVMDWNGDYAGGNAMAPPEVEATTEALSRYGALSTQHPGELPAPYLPARLGENTGADATLYVGGWGYVAKPADHSTANKVLEGVMIGLMVVTVVAVVLAVIGDHGGGGGGHSSGGSSHGSVANAGSGGSHAAVHGGGGGHAAGHGGAAVGGANIGGGISGGGISGGGGGTQVAGAKIQLSRHSFTASRGSANVHAGRIASHVIDAFGRAADIGMETDWGEDPALPDDGSASQLYLEMTLVDNHTGLTLWHARQAFPADATHAGDTARAAKLLIQRLPDRNAVPGTMGYAATP